MSIPITESQGSKLYLVAKGTDLTTVTKIETAIATAKNVANISTIGDLASSRNVTEYKVIDKTESAKSIGSLSLGNLPIELIYDAADTAGQADLKLMYTGNTRREAIVMLADEPTTGVTPHPTYFTFETGLSSEAVGIAIDTAVLYKITMEICSKPIEYPAAGTTV